MLMDIYIPAILVCVPTFLVTAAITMKFSGGIKKSVADLKLLVKKMENLDGCDMANMEILSEQVEVLNDKIIKDAWKRFKQDSELILGGKIVPEPTGYFNNEEIYTVPRGVKNLATLWAVLFGIAALIFCLPPAVTITRGYGGDVVMASLGVSFASVGFIALTFVIWYSYSKKAIVNGESELFAFVKGLESVLPVASLGAQTGLLLEGSRQNTIAFENTAKAIADKIDDFATNGITPIVSKAFEDSIKNNIYPSIHQMKINLEVLSGEVVKRQDEGMKTLANAFGDRLTNTIDGRIHSMCENVDSINGTMKELENNMKVSITTLESSLQDDRSALAEVCERIKETAGIQKAASESINVMSGYLETTGKLVETLTTWDQLIENSSNTIADSLRSAVQSNEETTRNLTSTMESLVNAGMVQNEKAAQAAGQLLNDIVLEMNKVLDGVGREIMGSITTASADIEKSSNVIADSLRSAVESNVETAKGLAGTMESLANAGTEQYEVAAQAAAKFLNDVIIEMNKAMDGVGHEIAESITKASSESVEIVDRLAETTGKLKEEYDTYFTRVENQSRTNMDDMDFHMQSVIGRFSEDAMGVMEKLEGNITKAMELFEGNTADLISSLDEQSRSIGLYAHDLNIDIADLSGNLKESVKIFTEQIQGGVVRTFQDFDEGLSEVSGRLANTVESIRESVENLPKALKDGK